MKKTFKRTSAFVCAMAVMAAPMTFSSFVANAEGETVTSDYTLTIPATLAVENSGWNSIGNLTATGTLAQGKKLNVTATSENSWKLTSGENTVAYKLCGETEKTKTYAEATDTTSLDISKELLEQTGGFSVPIGIVVEDYSEKPAGDYSDTVTFTASVENAAKTLTLSGKYFNHNAGNFVTKSLEIKYTDNDTWKDIAGRYDEVSLEDNIYGPEGKVVKFFVDENQGIWGCELKSNESTYNYNLVSINDKVSAYGSYYLENG